MKATRSVRIAFRGRLSPRLATAFDGMRLEQAPHQSILVGELTDQAQLHGLLSRICDLGLELESVTTAETRQPEDQTERRLS